MLLVEAAELTVIILLSDTHRIGVRACVKSFLARINVAILTRIWNGNLSWNAL
jgi:hypothetical protein